MRDNVYRGTRGPSGEAVVRCNGRVLPVGPSRRLRRHSEGFEWSYLGSGPAQLALAILQHECGDCIALTHYQLFKQHAIGRWPWHGWELTSAQVGAALAQIDRESRRPKGA